MLDSMSLHRATGGAGSPTDRPPTPLLPKRTGIRVGKSGLASVTATTQGGLNVDDAKRRRSMRARELWRSGRLRMLLAIACGALMQLLVTWSVMSRDPPPPPLALRESAGQPQDSDSKEPTVEYEQRRRRVRKGIHELWNYLSTELRNLQMLGQDPHAFKEFKIERVLELAEEHVLTLLTDFHFMKESDGYNKWREKEADALSDLVQRRLFFLQNPPRCGKARKLVCFIDGNNVFDYTFHHIAYCLIVAYGTQRTLILKSSARKINKFLQDYLEPISKTCLDANGISRSEWAEKKETQVVYLPRKEEVYPLPPYLPPAVPADLAPRLERLHGHPPAWWVGQFLKYIMRPQANMSTLLQQTNELIGFERPIVGVVIDNEDEEFDSWIEKHMREVEKYFDSLAHYNEDIQRRIFFVPGNQQLVDKIKLMYHHYEVLFNPKHLSLSPEAVINHIHFLSLCDYVVCAFSSHLCRLAYEITQSLYPDAADRFHSVDYAYHYFGKKSQNYEAIYPHYRKSEWELDLRVGDNIKVAINHWNGSSEGEHLRLAKKGLFPSFKAKANLETVDFPTYPQVPLKNL